MADAKSMAAGVVLGAAAAAGVSVAAAPGDFVYQDSRSAAVAAAQGQTLAQCFVAAGVWDGAAEDIEFAQFRKRRDDYWAMAEGEKSAAPEDLPADKPVVVKRRVGQGQGQGR